MAEPNTTFSDALGPQLPEEAALLILSEMDKEQMDELIRLAEEEQKKKEEMLSSLAGEIEAKFEDRSTRRSVKEAEWIDSYRMYLGPLGIGRQKSTPEGFFGSTANQGRNIEHNLVKPKCKIAIAQGLATQFAGGDKNWDIAPSPSPNASLTAEDYALLAVRAEAMEQEIFDQLNDTKYGFKCRQAYEDRVVLGTGVLKGPLPARFPSLTYDALPDAEGNLIPVPKHVVKNTPVLFRVDPWFFFPDDTVNDIDEAEDAIELHPMSKTQLMKLKKNPGFMADAIGELCKEMPKEYTNPTFTEYASLTASGSNVFRNKYAVLEYHGPVTRTQLDMLQIDPGYESENETYFGEVWVCQGRVIRVELEALAGTFELPYAVCPWLPDPGSIFGFGLPQEIRDPQRMANTALALMLKNASDSSGSIFVINTQMIEDVEGTYQFRPGKILTTTDYTLNTMDQAIKDYTVPNITGNLMPILGLAREFAQEESGTPQIAAGLDSPQVGSDSATGLAIMESNSTTINDYLAEAWDDRVTEKIIRRMYHYNMQFNPKPNIIGDFEVDVRSSTEFRRTQMAARDLEKLSVEVGQNPEMAKIIKTRNLTKARLANLHLPNADIVKSDDEIMAEEEEAKANPPPDPVMMELEIRRMEADAKMLEAQTRQQEIQLKGAQLQFEYGANQQREQWEHDERMTANAMRGQEANARVLEAQLLYQMEMAKLAQKDGVDHAKIMADIQKNDATIQAQQFLAGIKAQTEFHKVQTDAALTKEEYAIKRKQGSGI
jgi:hypothetical protein